MRDMKKLWKEFNYKNDIIAFSQGLQKASHVRFRYLKQNRTD